MRHWRRITQSFLQWQLELPAAKMKTLDMLEDLLVVIMVLQQWSEQ